MQMDSHRHGWTGMIEIIIAFLSFLNAPKNVPE
jgi:hypothetical protein